MAIPVLILAALLLYFWPVLFPAKTVAEEPVMPPNTPVQIEAPAEAGVESHPAMPAPITAPAEPAVARPLPAPTVAPAAAAAAVAGVPLVFQASAVSWVQVSDAKGVVVFSKTLQPGESAQAQGQAPLKVVIGNASSTQVTVKNQAFDVQPFVVNNVAHFEIQP
jgi:cytoskeleton protein RodZ